MLFVGMLDERVCSSLYGERGLFRNGESVLSSQQSTKAPVARKLPGLLFCGAAGPSVRVPPPCRRRFHAIKPSAQRFSCHWLGEPCSRDWVAADSFLDGMVFGQTIP